jgi:putative transposase
MAGLAAARDWLTAFRRPAYAPELNPAGPAGPDPGRSLASPARHGITQLATLARTRLRRMRYRPGLLEGFPAKPGRDLGNFHD